MIIKEVIVLTEVYQDLGNGRIFYEKREKGVGDYFWDSITSDIESLFIYAGIHSKKFDFYRMPAKRFPYAIYYDISDDLAMVVAVLPMRRNPTWVEDALLKRS